MYSLREIRRIWLALACLLTLMVSDQAAETTAADPFAPRAVVSKARKLKLALGVVICTAFAARRTFRRAELSSWVVRFQDVVSS